MKDGWNAEDGDCYDNGSKGWNELEEEAIAPLTWIQWPGPPDFKRFCRWHIDYYIFICNI
jgi:hypothetical protein